MKITSEAFGKFNGSEVELFTLSNDCGMTAKITNYGGIITSLLVPDSSGNPEEITCGFDTLDEYFSDGYRANSPYFGCIVGRYAGRIKDGKFIIAGEAFDVGANDGSNHLHGGVDSIDKRVWDAESFEEDGRVGLRLSIVSPDGDNGYPGNVTISVTYSLTNDNELEIAYHAVTDKATPLSLTHHAYFNLGGFRDQISGHRARIAADRFMVPDATNVPVGDEFAVAGSVWDYNEAKQIGDAFTAEPKGFEHYYVFNKGDVTFDKVAEFEDGDGGRRMEVWSTEPGMLFYTGFYTSDDLARNGDIRYGQFRGFCCETSRFPNGSNIPGSPRSVLHPGETYESRTAFRFS